MGNKEITFWSGKMVTRNYIYDFERYLDIADIAADVVLKTMQLDASFNIVHPVIFGDGTPSNFRPSKHWGYYEEHTGETAMLNAKYIHHLQPQAKIIYMLRNPVTTLYSAYKYFSLQKSVREDESVEKFHECVIKAIHVLLKCQETNTIYYCTVIKHRELLVPNTENRCVIVMHYLQMGRYHEFVQEWMKIFPRDQFMFIRFEDYIADVRKYILKAWKWLGIRDLQTKMGDCIQSIQPMNTANNDIGPMLQKTKDILYNFFNDQNMMLAALLNDTGYRWNDY